MHKSFHCPQGHQWAVSIRTPLAASLECMACPVCGAPAETLGPQVPASAANGADRSPPAPAAEPLPKVAGYEILGELGRGGMGVVYKARQKGLKRLVALKMLRGDALAGPEELGRFATEAEAVARLRHPNVVNIYEVGVQEGRPYFSLELVDGGSLAERLNGRPLPARPAAQLIETLARAVHAAHQCHVIHRDLKPANVLLTADGTPKITDFGLAKRLDEQVGQTPAGVILGTPSYLAPEQARGDPRAVGPLADVYALGAVLYEVLTGRPPFQAATVLDTLQQVWQQEPVPPTRLQPKVPRDLETICLKCLQKEPRLRYPSAATLAEDLRRFLAGEPLVARPAGPVGRALKWAKRRPAQAAFLGVSGLASLALVGVVVGLWNNGRLQTALHDTETQREIAARQRNQAEQERARFETLEASVRYLADVHVAFQAWDVGNVRLAEQLLDSHLPQPGRSDLRGFEWYYLWRLCHGGRRTLRGHDNSVTAVAVAPDRKTLASASEDGTVRLWDLPTGKEVGILRGHAGLAWVQSVAFSPDGKTLATLAVVSGYDPMEIKLWNTETRKERATLKGLRPSTGVCNTVAFSPDGKTLASVGNGKAEAGPPATGGIKLWNATTLEEEASVPLYDSAESSLAFSPDGHTLASAGQIKEGSGPAFIYVVKLWNTAAGQDRITLKGHTNSICSLAFAPDGKILATGGRDNTVRLWSVTGGEQLFAFQTQGIPGCLAFAPDQRTLVAGTNRNIIQRWDLETKAERAPLKGHAGPVLCLGFADGGGTLISGSVDRTIVLWDMARQQEKPPLKLTGWKETFSPDERTVASCSGDGKVLLWDINTGRQFRALGGTVGANCPPAFSPDGKALAAETINPPGGLQIWDVASGKEVAAFRGLSGGVHAVAFSRDGRKLAVGYWVWDAANRRVVGGEVRVWEVSSGRVLLTLQGTGATADRLAFSPDGRRLLIQGNIFAARNGSVQLWDTTTGQEALRLEKSTGSFHSMAFGPGGKLVVGGRSDGLMVWDAATGKWLTTLMGHMREVISVCFSADGKILATGSWDGTVKLWDTSSWQQRATFKVPRERVTALAFSSEGKVLAATMRNAVEGNKSSLEVKVWEAAAREDVYRRGDN